MNTEPIKHIELDGNHFKEMHPDTYSITRYIGVQVVDATEQIIHDAIIAAAKDAGLTDLYLIDRRFIVDAIREKQDRENTKPRTKRRRGMNTQKMIDELDRITQVLNGIVGRLSAASFRDTAVKEAHEIAITLGFEIDNLINELMEMEGDAK